MARAPRTWRLCCYASALLGFLSTACGGEGDWQAIAESSARSEELVMGTSCTLHGSGGEGSGSLTIFRNGSLIEGAPYAGVTDATIEAALPSTNQGAAEGCVADGQSEERSCLMRWHLSTVLPTSATVVAACLELTVSNPSRNTYEAFRLKRTWAEDSVTWTRPETFGSGWDELGAKGAPDRDSAPLASILPTTVGTYVINLDTATVQSWVSNPATNKGIIVAREDVPDGVEFVSSNAPLASQGPALHVWHNP